MNLSLASAFLRLLDWFEERRLRHKSLTVTLKFTDADEAASFNAELVRDVNAIMHYAPDGAWGPPAWEFEMCGIRFRVESPLHAKPDSAP